MALTGDFDKLKEIVRQLAEIPRGTLARQVRDGMGVEAMRLARDVWIARADPYGKPWMGNRGPLTLQRTGTLRASLRLVPTDEGFALHLDGQSLRRTHGRDTTLAMYQNWGGTSLARFRGTRGRKFRRKVMSMRVTTFRYLAAKAGARPMRFLINGRWVARYSVHLRSNKMLPDPNSIPDSWMHALENAGYKTARGAVYAMLFRR